jgi:hypothetical protein
MVANFAKLLPDQRCFLQNLKKPEKSGKKFEKTLNSEVFGPDLAQSWPGLAQIGPNFMAQTWDH